MAYSTSNPPGLVSQRLGADGGALWIYKDADELATVLASGYISDAAELGIKAGDKVIHIDSGNETSTDLIAASHTNGTASGATCSAIEPVGETSIVLASAGTGTILQDDIIKFGNDADNEYRVTSANETDVSDGGTLTITPGLVTATAADTTITVQTDVIKLRAANLAPAIVIDQARTLTDAESGSTLYFNNATGFAVNLPAPALGLNYKFITALAISSGNHTIVADAAVIQGNVTSAGLVVAAANETTVTVVGTAEFLGDWIYFESDGTNWYVSGQSQGAGYTFA